MARRTRRRDGASASTRDRQPLGGWLLLALAVVVLDQLGKLLVLRAFAPGERLPVVPGWFDLTLLYNPGAAFSFLASAGGWQRWFLTGVGVIAAVVIAWMLWRHGNQRLFAAGLALILGGAIGNVIDRIWLGQVVDFLLVYRGSWHWPAFNLADSAITAGAALLILDELRRVRRGR
ncbi:MAG: lipoprotein signal peptidase [Betaproteobacteria bacterium]|nr:lipoprotein signal peptidase [Betaproteobacteria bacterium]